METRFLEGSSPRKFEPARSLALESLRDSVSENSSAGKLERLKIGEELKYSKVRPIENSSVPVFENPGLRIFGLLKIQD